MLIICKATNLGEAMFDEVDIFENIFAAINVCPKLGDATLNEDDIFNLPSFDMQIYNDDSMPPTYDDYCDDTYAIKSSDDYIYKTFHHYDYPFSEHYSFNVETIYSIRVSYDTPTIPNEKNFAYVESSKFSMLVDHEKNALGAGYIVEFIHDATENYYERGTCALTYCNNTKFPLYVLKFLKLCLVSLPMLVDHCSHKLFSHKIPMHRKWVILKCASHMLHDAPIMFQFLSFM